MPSNPPAVLDHPVSKRWPLLLIAGFTISSLIPGCSSDSDDPSPAAGQSEVASDGDSATQATGQPAEQAGSQPAGYELKPLQLGSLGTPESGSESPGGSKKGSMQSVIEALKPLQIMLGRWRGTTRKEYENFKAVDEHEWVFDFKTNREQPALVMTSDKSPYVQTARLTYLIDDDLFQLQLVDREGHERILTGGYTQPVEDKAEDGQKLQRTFKLELNQQEQGDAPDRWQVTFNQQENNRYLMIVSRARGQQTDFRLYDTVSIQREGTSFALNDADYGEKECIVSQGLGTTALTYNGKTYWVCCSGCKAAFEEDPEVWIARAAEREKAKSN